MDLALGLWMIRLLCITDPLTHPPFDTTVDLYRLFPEDSRFQLCHLQVDRLGDGHFFPVTPVPRPLDYQAFRALGAAPVESAGFADFDLVFSRADLPHPPGYMKTLARHENTVQFIGGRPSGLIECGGRGFYRAIASRFMPEGTVTRDVAEAVEFVRAHGRVVAKRNRSYGGKGLSRIWQEKGSWWLEWASGEKSGPDALEVILAQLFASDPDPFEFVRYLESVVAGDKRVLVVEGELYGAFLRLAADGGWINNQTAGGSVHPATITPAEEAIVRATWQTYHDRGVDLLGYDFLVDDSGEPILSEINASSNIGGYGMVEQTSGVPVYSRLLDWIHGLVGR